MAKYVALIKFTADGVGDADKSLERAEKFRANAEKAGVKVLTQLWTMGPYDGLLVLEGPEEQAVAALLLDLAHHGRVSTCTLRAFDAAEFAGVVKRLD